MASIRRLLAAASACIAMASAAPVQLRATTGNGQELKQVPVQVEGRTIPAWRCDGNSRTLDFKPSVPFPISPDGILYLKISYVDDGYGKLNVGLVPEGAKPIRPDRYLELSRTNSGKPVSALMRIRGIPSSATRGTSVRIGLERPEDGVLSIGSVTVQETPFDDERFKYVISDPWLGPYRGPGVKPPDNSTLKGKMMAGYQGWFRTPNDPEGRGWFHWGNIQTGNFSTDMWPDLSMYPPSSLEKAADVRLKSGKQGYLFSSAWPGVVDTHFSWMRHHEIDGVFLQRFVTENLNPINGGPEWVLANVRAAANREGRIWAIEYDVSGYPDEKLLETLKTDWKWLVDTFGLLQDQNYAREGGKPVVFIWGLPFPDRKISLQTANAVVDFFRNDPKYGGNYVIGGIPGNWRGMDDGWQEHFKKYECVLPWMSPSYAQDIGDFKKLGLSCYTHVKPGFSWANLKHLPTGDDSLAYTPRDGGRYYWNQLAEATRAGADRVFVGMFDEYDEGTAIMPMSDDPPPTPVRNGVAATFYNGAYPLEGGDFVLLPAAELVLGDKAPGKRISPTNFFVRMGGQIIFPAAGQYKFSVEGAPGDDVDLIVNGENILSARNLEATATSTTEITANENEAIPFRLEYRHRMGTGTLRLLWESPAIARQPVPPAALRDAWGRFLTNEGKPSDWWLKLTQAGKQMMNGKRGDEFPPQ